MREINEGGGTGAKEFFFLNLLHNLSNQDLISSIRLEVIVELS